jgi:putative ABC transport system substrate-binding protein
MMPGTVNLAASGVAAGSRAALQQGLRKLGYIEGQNIKIEYRYAEGRFERLPVLASELVLLKVDVILTGGSTATRAAKEATNTIPIVMLQDNDPVASGFVASLGVRAETSRDFQLFAPRSVQNDWKF